jgi:amino acid adenylation domain-containing protein
MKGLNGSTHAPAGHDKTSKDSGGIAIIGMSARVPGASSVDALWDLIREGRDSFRLHAADEIEDTFTDEERALPNYVPARPGLDDIDKFDAEFFGMFPREAAATDPQHRIFLEVCWEALESAGYDPHTYPGLIGLFAGASMATYLMNNVLSDRAKVEEYTSNYQIGSFQEAVGSLTDVLSTRVAYKLNLRGPAYTIQSACSTSLLAVSQACQNLLSNSCDMALAGGVSITLPQKRGYLYQEGGMVSRDGICRPFDADASGTVFASGAGAVLLKRLDDAVRDGDHIFAVIRGCGVNNDGSEKIGFTAPSASGQADAIATAMANAGFDASTIGYVELHGTATPLGDPIEFAGLRSAFTDARAERALCALGSLKGNVGHMDAAAGVCGLMRAALSIHHGKIPPMPNYRAPNARIDIDNSPFYVPTTLSDWPESGVPRRAGVSSFGVGGTNVHVVLEEAPAIDAGRGAIDQQPLILPLSARNEPALTAMRANLAAFLAGHPETPLSTVAHTLQSGRRAFRHRTAIVAADSEQAIRLLGDEATKTAMAEDVVPPVVFMFPGQGAQYVGMGAGLYRTEPEFARWIDRGAELIKMYCNFDPRDYICHTGPVSHALEEEQRETRIAQPCIYLVEYALARLWLSRGLRPDAMIGHSVGEFAAATLANVMSFEDGLKLVAMRGRLMQAQQAGAMVSVRSDADSVADYLVDGVEIAAVNAPKLCVISGTFAATDVVCAKLEKAGIAFSRLHTSHAFHSAMMEPCIDALCDEAAKLTYGTATLPYVSCVTGDWQTDEEGASPLYWARHCREPVLFGDGLATICAGQKPVLLEVGPGRTLSTFAAQTIGRSDVAAVIQSMPEHNRAHEASATLAEAQGRLWMAGCDLNWPQAAASGRKHPLPTYPFQRQRHWIEAPASARRAKPQAPVAVPQPQAIVPADLTMAAVPPAAVPATLVEDMITTDGIAHMNIATPIAASSRIPRLETSLLALLSEMSGETIELEQRSESFLELGFDSLFVGQFAQKLERQYGVKLSFRELLSNIPTVAALARHLDAEMPPEAPQAAEPVAAPIAMPAAAPVQAAPVAAAQPVAMPMPALPMMAPLASSTSASTIQSVLQSQMQMMQAVFAQQLQVLQVTGGGVPVQAAPVAAPQMIQPAAPAAPAAPAIVAAPAAATAAQSAATDAEIGNDRIKIYKPGAKREAQELSAQARTFITDLITAYESKHKSSKAFTAEHRALLADPRTASGFRADLKEIVFPIVAARSKGSRIWDLDGNEFIDLVNGFGQTAFGHAPDFVVEAVKEQSDLGFAIGPQSTLAGDVAKTLAEITGHERITFCNTGSEAVMAAMRLARSVTGRDKIVCFASDYHGQFDEVLVKGRNNLKNPVALPVASGIPQASVSNMVVLRYGAPESLEWIRANADDLAAVMIEPIQSRHPELRPVEFVRELREITKKSGAALVFDEVVTGFRVAKGGMQEIWGIQGDMASYGKVLGGGMPIGILAGDARFMDALDGGNWNYGDDSVPEIAPTFFAGTFVRHPVVLAATKATLDYIQGEGSALYGKVAERTEALVAEINADLAERGFQHPIYGYKSWFVTNFGAEDPMGALLYAQLRLNGVYIQEGYPCFLTTTHTEEDFRYIARAFRDSVDMLQSAGLLQFNADRTGGRIAAAASAEAMTGGTVVPFVRPSSVKLTEAQSEVWLAAQLGDEASCSFNESMTLFLDGDFNEAAFLNAFDMVIARHDAMHIRFERSGDRFTFTPDYQLDVPTLDVSGDADPAASLARLRDEEARTPFDLVNGPLARGTLVKLGDKSHALVFTGHHIVCDGWSLNVMVGEISEAYSQLVRGHDPKFEPAMSYASYATDFAPKPKADGKTDLYWRNEYRQVPELIDMPYDRPHPDRRTFNGGSVTGWIDAETYKALKKRGAKSGATLFSTMLATLQVMVARLSGQSDIVIAVPSAGQTLVEDRILVGHAVNLLPIRQTVDTKMAFDAHLKATQQKVFQAFEHQDYTYGTLVRMLGVKRDASRLPLTGIQFNLEKVGGGAGFDGLSMRIEPNDKAFSNFDMFLNMIETTDGIRIDVDYNADVLDRATVSRWIGHLVTLAKAEAENMERPIVDLPLLSATEAGWLSDGLNATSVDYDANAFMFTHFAREVAAHPEKVAAVHGGIEMTYGELEARSNRLARFIKAALPGKGERVALIVDRSLDMLVSLIAIMKTGHAYVPLDPAHPETRLRQTLEAARPGAVIIDRAEHEALAGNGVGVILLDRDRAAIDAQSSDALADLPKDTDAAAYIIFTSGSTGQPKGVAVPHKALTNFLVSMAQEPGMGADDTLVAVTTVSFDIAGLELYLPLITGGKVVIADRTQVQDGFALVKLVEESKATVLQGTPTLWQMLVEAGIGKYAGLKMLCGGEPLPKELARTLVKSASELWNMYGPTETTIWSSVEKVEDNDAPITIGHPIANTQLYILDNENKIAPVGVTGELHIGGDGLAIGYFDRKDLTDNAFVMCDIGDGTHRRLYKTGDVGRRLTDGSLQLLGRRDNQIKLRGFRIELGDIESVVAQYAGIRVNAVVPVKNAKGDLALVCYYMLDGGVAEPEMAELSAHAKAHLPAHMVPAYWVMVDEMPQTGNGKLDRKALVARGLPQRKVEAIIIAPRNPMEEQLSGIWKDILNLDSIGIDDNLYSLGADSLTIFRIAARMLDEGLGLEAKHLLRHPTIAELAKFAEEQKSVEVNPAAYKVPSLKDFRNGARRRIESVQ